ncbi:hypothetical protein IMG5_197160, partial [Ichthyophthirius multifiliis]
MKSIRKKWKQGRFQRIQNVFSQNKQDNQQEQNITLLERLQSNQQNIKEIAVITLANITHNTPQNILDMCIKEPILKELLNILDEHNEIIIIYALNAITNLLGLEYHIKLQNNIELNVSSFFIEKCLLAKLEKLTILVKNHINLQSISNEERTKSLKIIQSIFELLSCLCENVQEKYLRIITDSPLSQVFLRECIEYIKYADNDLLNALLGYFQIYSECSGLVCQQIIENNFLMESFARILKRNNITDLKYQAQVISILYNVLTTCENKLNEEYQAIFNTMCQFIIQTLSIKIFYELNNLKDIIQHNFQSILSQIKNDEKDINETNENENEVINDNQEDDKSKEALKIWLITAEAIELLMGVLVNIFEKECESDIYEDEENMNSDCDEDIEEQKEIQVVKSCEKKRIRREDKSIWERRASLTPEDIQQLLLENPNIKFIVQPSETRIFSNFEYEQVGAIIKEELYECQVILGVREIPRDKLLKNKTYLFFSDTTKAQVNNMKMLDCILEKNIRLIDYEKIQDGNNTRLITFGKLAGISSCINFLSGLGLFLLTKNIASPFINISLTHKYFSIEQAYQQLKMVSKIFQKQGITPSLRPLIFAIIGNGRCAQGTLEVLQNFPIKIVSPDDLQLICADKNNQEHGKYIYFPYEYTPIFHNKYLPYISVIFQNMQWEKKFPRLITDQQLQQIVPLKLLGICDVSCMKEGAIQCVKKITTPECPFNVVDIVQNKVYDGPAYRKNGIIFLNMEDLARDLAYDANLVLEEVKILKNNTKKYKHLLEIIDQFYNELEGQMRIQQKTGFKFPIDNFNQLIETIAETKKSKVNIYFLSFIQNLLNLQLLNYTAHDNILNYLLKIQELNKEQVQIKVQQTFFLLLDPSTISIENSVFIEKVLKMLILMKSSKNQLLQNTSYSSLDQLIENIINEVIQNNQKNLEKQRLLAQLLYDFIVVADEQKSQWWPKNINVDKEIGFQVIFYALNMISKKCFHSKEIQNLFKFNLFPLIKKNINIQQNSQQFMLSLYRGIVKSIIYLEDEFEQLEIYFKFLQQKELVISKFLSFECINYFISQSEILFMFLIQLDIKKQDNVIKFYQLYIFDQQFLKFLQISPKVSKVIENNDNDIEFPCISHSLIMKECLDFYHKLSISLEIIFSTKLGIKLGKKKQKSSANFDIFYSIFDIIWKNVYQSIKLLLTKQTDEQQFQNLLNTIQTFTNLSGSIGNVSASDQFIKAICNYSLPKNSDMTPKNIQTNKMVLNISHCLGNLLDTNGWFYILTFLQKSEYLYNKNRIARDNTQEEQIKLSDIQILQNTLDYLFQNSANYDNDHLLTFINSLFSITFEYISTENKILQKKNNDNSSVFKQKHSIFSIQKIYETIKVNLYRIDILWDLVSANFLVLCTNKNQYFREKAVESLGDFILEAFQFIADSYNQQIQENSDNNSNNISSNSSNNSSQDQPDIKQSQKKPKQRGNNHKFKNKEKWTKEEWQHTLFQPWIDVIKCGYNESKEVIMNNILKILQNNGHMINKNGWNQLLNILNKISTDSDQNYVCRGIKCIELLVNQYLSNLHHSKLSNLLKIIENFKKYSRDHLVKHQTNQNQIQMLTKEEFAQLMQSILEKLLFLCTDPHAEARNSAQHIFSSLIVHNFTKLQSIDILNSMVWEMAENVLLKLKQEMQKNQNDKLVYWEETAQNTCQHLCKIIKRSVQLHEKPENDSEIQNIPEIIDRVMQIFFKYIQVNLSDISVEVIKSYREIFKLRPFICIQNFNNNNNFENLLVYLQKQFSYVPNNIKIIKNIFQKLIPECIFILEDFCLLSIENNNNVFLNIYKSHIGSVFQLFNSILMYSQLVSEDINMKQQKIFFDEKQYVELLEKMSKNTHLQQEYNLFFNKLIHLPVKSIVIDGLKRKFIPVIINHIKNGNNIPSQVIIEHIFAIQSCILAKNSIEYMELLNNIKQRPIWAICTEIFVDIVNFLLEKSQDLYLEILYNIIYNYFMNNKYSINDLIKYYTPDQIKEYFEGERILLELIMYKLLPNVSNENIGKFANILFQNSNLKMENENAISQFNLEDLGIHFNKNCLTFLCKFSSQDSILQNQEKNILFLPFFLNRCRIILDNFVQEQKTLASVSYKATKIKDIDFVLSLIKNLKIYHNSFKIIHNNGIFQQFNLPFEISNNNAYYLNSQYGH